MSGVVQLRAIVPQMSACYIRCRLIHEKTNRPPIHNRLAWRKCVFCVHILLELVEVGEGGAVRIICIVVGVAGVDFSMNT